MRYANVNCVKDVMPMENNEIAEIIVIVFVSILVAIWEIVGIVIFHSWLNLNYNPNILETLWMLSVIGLDSFTIFYIAKEKRDDY